MNGEARLPKKEYINGHRCERTNIIGRWKIFVIAIILKFFANSGNTNRGVSEISLLHLCNHYIILQHCMYVCGCV